MMETGERFGVQPRTEALIAKVQKEGEKALREERKAAGCIPVGDKKKAATASIQAAKAAANADLALQDGKQALSAARQSLLNATRLQEEVKNKKAELQKLRDTAYAVAVEDDEVPGEDDEGAEDETDGDPNLASLQYIEARLQTTQEEATRAHTSADRAAVAALVAVATSALAKAAKTKIQKQAGIAAAAHARPSAPLQDITNHVS